MASQQIYELLSEFEWCFFKFDSLTRCIWEEKAVVYVDDMPFIIYHYITIMSIFYLKHVTC